MEPDKAVSELLNDLKTKMDLHLDGIVSVIKKTQVLTTIPTPTSTPEPEPNNVPKPSGASSNAFTDGYPVPRYEQVFPSTKRSNDIKSAAFQNTTISSENMFRKSESQSTVRNSTPTHDLYAPNDVPKKSSNVPFNVTSMSISPVCSRTNSISDDLKYVNVPINKYVLVQPSFIYSARNFYVHFDYDAVAHFNIKLNECYNDKIQKTPFKLLDIRPKMLCCIFEQNESNYLRAQVIKAHGATKYIVFLVDFGESLIVDAKVIFPLDPAFAHFPIFAVNCYLNEHWNEDVTALENLFRHFFTLVNEQQIELQAKFSPASYGRKYPVSLMARVANEQWQDALAFVSTKFSGLALCDELRKQIFDVEKFCATIASSYNKECFEAFSRYMLICPNKTKLSLHRNYRVISSFVLDVFHFICVILEMPLNSLRGNDTIHVNAFVTNMTHFYSNALVDFQRDMAVNEKTVVAFKLDSFYFRGFILNSVPCSIRILSLDFGFIKSIPAADIVPLVDMFSLDKYPMFSILCSMDGIKEKDLDLDTATVVLRDMFKCTQFDLKTNLISHDKHLVKITYDNVDINDALKYL